jgi:hypothetical protein
VGKGIQWSMFWGDMARVIPLRDCKRPPVSLSWIWNRLVSHERTLSH